MREATDGAFPRYVVLENVPGLLSSNGGRDFAVVLGELAGLGALDIAWRVLDAQWFGVAQRRQRVFIVADFRTESGAAQVLFEPTSCGGDSAPRRETGESVAASLTRGAASGSGVNAPSRRREDDINLVPLAFGGNNTSGPIPVACTQNSRDEVRYINGDGAISGALGAQEGMKQRTYVAESSSAVEVADAKRVGANQTTGVKTEVVSMGMAVRRLTPIECERLMGFDDDWTAFGADGKLISDSARYRMLGNSIVMPVTQWIGERIVATA